MSDINELVIEGEIVDYPNIQCLANEGRRCKFTISCRRDAGTRGEKIVHLTIMTLGRVAEVCAEHLRHGERVKVHGWLEQDCWGEPFVQLRSNQIYMLAEVVEREEATA